MKKIYNIAVVGLGQVGIYLLNELNHKKKNIEIKTGTKINVVAISAKNIKKKLLKLSNIIIDSKSGYSGAGRGVHKKYKDKNLNESLSAYGVSFHRHNSEIEQTIRKYTKSKFDFTFTPHLSPMFRGILSTIYIDLNKGKTVNSLYNELIRFYKNSTFVKVIKMNSLISTNDVINTNNCLISVCKSKYKNKAIILSSIDNLIKGGAGQAIQNMNIKFDFKYDEALK